MTLNLRKKKIEEFSNAVREVIYALSFNDKFLKIAGSNSVKTVLFPSDYDFYEVVHLKYATDVSASINLAAKIKKIIQNLTDIENCYVGDIKLGGTLEKPLRWTVAQIMKGRNKNVQLSDCFTHPAMTKIDAIVLIDGVYTEFSTIYEFWNNGRRLNNYKSSDLEGIYADIKTYYDEGNYFKSAKRIFSYYTKTKQKPKVQKQLLDLFNSDLGLWNQVCNNIVTLIYMFENYNKLDIDKIHAEMDGFIEKLSRVGASALDIDILRKLQETKNKNTILKQLKKLNKYLFDNLQTQTKAYLKNIYLFPLHFQ
jgi:hypothetical protein